MPLVLQLGGRARRRPFPKNLGVGPRLAAIGLEAKADRHSAHSAATMSSV